MSLRCGAVRFNCIISLMTGPADIEKKSRRKAWLTPDEQVAHLKSKGVRFDLISEADSIRYLTENSNYFRLRSYRTGFARVEEGKRAGEYARLDFKMLIDLSIIDMLLRYEMLPMTLDVEHFAKVRLLGKIEASGEDGYAVVSDFLAGYDRVGKNGDVRNVTKDEISRGKPRHGARYAVMEALGRVDGIGAGQRRSKMSNERFQQIVTTLYMHERLASSGIHAHKCVELAEFVERMNRHPDYYAGNCQVLSGFDFLTKIIGAWFPVEAAEKGLETPTKQE